MTKHYKN